jgi:S-DNA-T family DNA segregation ATPase FtsK/SpoIIIE
MAKTMTRAGSGGILPDGTIEFFKRRLKEAGGLFLITVSLAFIVALVTFTPSDTSFNTAATGPLQNLLGSFGAYTADILLQALGLASLIPLIVCLSWGWKTLTKKSIHLFWLRMGLLITAILGVSTGLAGFSTPNMWPFSAGLGGVLGNLLIPKLVSLTQLIHPVINNVWVGVVMMLMGMVSFLVALNVTWSDWRAGIQTVSSGIQKGLQGGAHGLSTLALHLGERTEFITRPLADSFKQTITAPVSSSIKKPLHFLWPFKISFSVKRRDAAHRQEPSFNPDAEGADEPIHEDTGLEPTTLMVPTSAAKTAAALSNLVAPLPQKVRTGRREAETRQGKLKLSGKEEHQIPPFDLLEAPDTAIKKNRLSQDALKQNAVMLSNVLEEFGVRGEIIKVRPGPVVTLYELEPAPGTKTSRVIGLADDIARSMSAASVRVAVVPGRNAIGIELPNVEREMVYLREILASESMDKISGNLNLALGKDIGGNPIIPDLSRMPHLLIAGTTGSGKSVAINTMILSLLYQLSPEQCKMIMIDPKMLELSVYEGIPHLITPVVTEPGKAVMALKWAVREMEDRYRVMSHIGVRNIAGYNKRIAEEKKKGTELARKVQTGFDEKGKPVFEEQPLSMDPLPLIVVVVDEMADLMLVAGKDIEATVQRLAQMARAAGIHLIMATQRPSVDVITGTIKANFPTRISFQVTSKIDSRTILGEQGAEQLLGQGDMLFMEGGGRITRVHGPFVSDEEVEHIVSFLKEQGEPTYLEEITAETPETAAGMSGSTGDKSGDELYDEAVALIARENKASTSFIQRHLQIGYNRAARIIERMEKEGVVSEASRVGRREVLVGHPGELVS